MTSCVPVRVTIRWLPVVGTMLAYRHRGVPEACQGGAVTDDDAAPPEATVYCLVNGTLNVGYRDVGDIRRYIKLGPLGQAFAAAQRVVLLIDEVDKADMEFPNDLLHELDLMQFSVIETGDESVMPGLRRLALEAAKGQSIVGSWGHKFAGPDGRLQGYGMMNAPGLPLTISLILAREAGVDDAEVAEAIEKSARLIRFYAGKGAVPYGDHHPWIQTHEDNGKCSIAAVLFDLLGDRGAATFFAKMSTAGYDERERGHTGNFFNILWPIL